MQHLTLNVASSGRDIHGDLITEEAVRLIVDSINNDDRVAKIGIEHDPFCMPQGKVLRASTARERNKLVAKCDAIVHDAPLSLQDNDTQQDLVALFFDEHPQRFKRTAVGEWSEQCKITVNPTSFSSQQDAVRFLKDCASIDGLALNPYMVRKFPTPEPMISVLLCDPEAVLPLFITSAWMQQRVFKDIYSIADESTWRQAGRLVDRLESMIASAVDKFFSAPGSTPASPTTVELVVPGDDIEVTLLRRVTGASGQFHVNAPELVSALNRFRELVDFADQITLSWTEDDHWNLEYVATKSGHVIGTAECYAYSHAEFERINRTPEQQDNTETD